MKTLAVPPSYGSRGNLRGTDAGIRRVASTFGKRQITSYSDKAGGAFTPESPAESFIADVLTLDPRVRSFRCQPFTLDLIDGRILRTAEERAESRRRHKGLPPPRFYTPDFVAHCSDGQDLVLEVKSEDYEGDASIHTRLVLGQELLQSAGYRFLRVVVPKDPWLPLRLNLGALTLAASRPELRPTAALANALAQACGDSIRTLGEICLALHQPVSQAPGWLVGGVFTADLLRQPINFDMQVACAYGELTHLSLIEELAA
jgi:hypothetical protein